MMMANKKIVVSRSLCILSLQIPSIPTYISTRIRSRNERFLLKKLSCLNASNFDIEKSRRVMLMQ